MTIEDDNDTDTIDLDEVERPNVVDRPDWAIRHNRETARGRVTAVLIAVFAAILLYPLIAVPFGWVNLEETEKIMSLLLPAITGILGAVVGFYFGASN